MNAANNATALRWPHQYPPRSRWMRFLVGIPLLGPDLSFFRELESRQASRTSTDMARWHALEQRELALRMGETLSRMVGWRSPYFMPDDSFAVVVHGPRFHFTDDLRSADALRQIESHVRPGTPPSFWNACSDLSYGEVVVRLLAFSPNDMRR